MRCRRRSQVNRRRLFRNNDANVVIGTEKDGSQAPAEREEDGARRGR